MVVISAVLAAVTLFFVALVPVITDQVTAIVDNAPGWLRQLQNNQRIQDLDSQYGVIDKLESFITSGDWASGLFGGVIGIGLAVLGFLANAFLVVVLTLYFLASLTRTKSRSTSSRPPAGATASRSSATGSSPASGPTSPAPSWSRWPPGSRR